MSDALMRKLLSYREEEPESVRQYIREAWYRHDANMPQEPPHTFFQAPRDWEPPEKVQETFDGLNDLALSE